MAEQNDIDLDSVIDRLLEGESMSHMKNSLTPSPPILFTRPFVYSLESPPSSHFSPPVVLPLGHTLH